MALDKITAAIAKHNERKIEAEKRAQRLDELNQMTTKFQADIMRAQEQLAKVEREADDHIEGLDSIYGDGVGGANLLKMA